MRNHDSKVGGTSRQHAQNRSRTESIASSANDLTPVNRSWVYSPTKPAPPIKIEPAVSLTSDRKEKLLIEVYSEQQKPQPLPYEVIELMKVFDWKEDIQSSPNMKGAQKAEQKVDSDPPIIVDFEQVQINYRSFREYVVTKKRLLETYLNIQREDRRMISPFASAKQLRARIHPWLNTSTRRERKKPSRKLLCTL
ncbi:hypothetical protein FGO68_gene1594 [Halteria grandinella]|uniref:Uncharacterized protein n=1 Tax=Halteria grandinella TaxID=5974 RepID=A0A8J8NWH6_HALGN|nr:hypothetical protein FGO68_gene1594 [Halteria grandinella]